MKKYALPVFLAATLAGCGGGGLRSNNVAAPVQPSDSAVQVSSPTNNSTVPPQVHFVANATTPCEKGVTFMSVYTAANVLAYTTRGSSIDTNIDLQPGTYNTSVDAVDGCGNKATTPVAITVNDPSVTTSNPPPPPSNPAPPPSNPAPPPAPPTPGKSFTGLQKQGGWTGYGLLPPSYKICGSCKSSGPEVTWSMTQGVSSPSLSGNATKYDIGGKMQFADVLWNNHLIGDFSSQGLPDKGHSLAPSLHNFVYDVYFYSDKMETSQAVEFDINQFVNGKSFIWGHECRIAGGHAWDIWDNKAMQWRPTGIACNPKKNAWNHLVIQVQRTSDDQLLFQTITLNGKTATVNYKEPPTSTGWYGITINYQIDGNRNQDPYSVWLDKVTFNYW